MKVSEVQKMKSLEEENAKLKRLVAELSLEKMKAIVAKRPKASCEMITMLLHNEGIEINHKRVERLYKENKMQLKNRKRGHKKYSVKKREEHILTETPGNWIAIDFVIDSVANKRPLKNLTVIDPVSKVAPKIVPAYAMQGEGVAQVLNDIWLEEPCSYTSILTTWKTNR